MGFTPSNRSVKPYQQFFAELKRRRVFRVAAVYGGTSFALLQAADLLAQGLGLPDEVFRLVTLLILLGFPIAVGVTWAFEITPGGFRRTEAATSEELASIVAQPALERWLSGGLALLGIAALLGSGWWIGRRTAPDAAATAGVQMAFADPATDPRPSLAVLPFANLSSDPEQEYFADGITEELITSLARVRQIRVAARTSASVFKGRAVDLRVVGDSLGVSHFIEGSVQRSGEVLRITAQLIQAKNGTHLWAEQYDRPLGDVFQIQTEIAEAIAAALAEPLGLDEARGLVTATEDIEAFDLYLEGRARMKERGAGVMEAVKLFEAAIARDSTWAPAWAGLAEAEALSIHYESLLEGFYNDSAFIADKLDVARRATERALALDPRNASAAVARANILRDLRRWDEAEAAYLGALALDPDHFEAHQQYAELLDCVGRSREALAPARRALRLDRSAIRLNIAGVLARRNGLWDEAEDLLTEGIEADPGYNLVALRGNMLWLHFALGRWQEGRKAWLAQAAVRAPEFARELERAWPDTATLPTDALAELFAERIVVADRWKLRPGAAVRPVVLRDPWASAYFWMVLGEHERALAVLEYLEEGPFGCFSQMWDAAFDPLRGDPRFQRVMRGVDLEPRWPDREADATPRWPSRGFPLEQ